MDIFMRIRMALLRPGILAALAVAAVLQTDAAAASPFTALVVFGDSLSDNGNAGRFSDGPVWVEVLAAYLGTELKPSRVGGTNFAVGGARSHGRPMDIRGQLYAFMTGRHGLVDASALFVIYGGANDLLAAGCDARETAAKTGAAAIAATAGDLAAAGATHILVPNLPDLGASPIVRLQGAACARRARQMTRSFNAALEQELRRVERRSGVRIVRVDAYGMAEEIMANPGKAGFADVSTPCQQGSCAGALFWDQLHPTARAHARMAAEAVAALGLRD
ncbi:MAG: SGNH/GDSL hydrolase family protein [Rhodospirillales bacterium]|nr:SGNH/GDSL hydrolase family protein [Rhodospirillales bacterium]